ncbi:cysteine hydrolase family protein [Leifsonia poae]|uniref:Cysteine hydrolase n=1 Tax=Leifsonia poae TaxID=110933 RepID=A0A9W6HBM7_9MICO|nr:isochorismatase family cysteine hydrolase [Leifsonia poae]GLJ76947.1 cysteine hydrolase [Leifsonia poae]
MNDLRALDPARTALLLMDLQPSILGQHPDADGFLAQLLAVRDAARSAGLTVGYVHVALTAEEASLVSPNNIMFSAAATSGRMLAADAAVQVDPRIQPADGEIVVRKSRVGAFSTTDLREQLESRGIDTVVLTGISTSGVVLSTVRDAADRDFRVIVLSDGVFDRDPEVHRVLTEKVFPRQAEVVTAGDFVAALG